MAQTSFKQIYDILEAKAQIIKEKLGWKLQWTNSAYEQSISLILTDGHYFTKQVFSGAEAKFSADPEALIWERINVMIKQFEDIKEQSPNLKVGTGTATTAEFNTAFSGYNYAKIGGSYTDPSGFYPAWTYGQSGNLAAKPMEPPAQSLSELYGQVDWQELWNCESKQAHKKAKKAAKAGFSFDAANAIVYKQFEGFAMKYMFAESPLLEYLKK